MIEYAYSHNEETFHGSFSTEHEAIVEGFAGTNRAKIWVGEHKPPTPPEQLIDADTVIEAVIEQDEYCGEWSETWPDASEAQMIELTAELRKTFGAWMDKHGLRPTFFTVPEAKEISRPDDMPVDPDDED